MPEPTGPWKNDGFGRFKVIRDAYLKDAKAAQALPYLVPAQQIWKEDVPVMWGEDKNIFGQGKNVFGQESDAEVALIREAGKGFLIKDGSFTSFLK